MTNKKKVIANPDAEWGNIELPGMSDEQLLNTNWNYVAINREKAETPVWRKAFDEGMSRRNNSDKFINSIKKRSQDPNWIKANKDASDKRWSTKEHYDKIANANKVKASNENWLKQTREGSKKRNQRDDWKDICKGRGKKIRKPWVAKSVGVFETINDLASHYNVTTASIRNWAKSKPDEFYQISQEEYIMLTGKDPFNE